MGTLVLHRQRHCYCYPHPMTHTTATNSTKSYETEPTWEGEKGSVLTGVLLGVIELLVSGDRAMRRRLRWLRMDGGVMPPGEIGMSSPLLLLLSSWRALPSNRNWCRSGLGLSSARSKAVRLHQPSRSWMQTSIILH